MFPYLFPDLFILPVSFCYSDVYVTTFFFVSGNVVSNSFTRTTNTYNWKNIYL